MTTGLLFVLICLAAHRITRLLTTDTVPLVALPREWLLTHWRTKARPLPEQGGVANWADIVTCEWCVGVYVAAATVALVDLFATVPLPALIAVAAASAVGLLSRLDG